MKPIKILEEDIINSIKKFEQETGLYVIQITFSGVDRYVRIDVSNGPD